jgi:hypothetical protein
MTAQLTGNMQFAINAVVDHVMDPGIESEPWEILAHACYHLCAHVMERGDVQAWNLMRSICDQL